MDKYPSAFDLFKQYQPRYRQIGFLPGNFWHDEKSARLYLHPTQGLTENKSFSWISGSYPHFDLGAGGLDIVFKYEPHNGSYHDQTRQAIWRRLIEGPFATRKFFADPIGINLKGLAVHFSVDGDEVPGLVLPRINPHGWWFFVPSDSPEGRAIRAAEQLAEGIAAENAKVANPTPTPDRLATVLSSLVAAAA